ncbi:MAG: DUF3316 domain-containing protein [Dysgonamonadaceae bacterium]|nr:DUF3316 domain-containing protein [Dysgonamonadaceae bacterium]
MENVFCNKAIHRRIGKIAVLLLLFNLPLLLCAQEEEAPVNLSYRSVLIGGGSYSLYDTYLSGRKSIYDGWGARILGDYMKMTGLLQNAVSSQHLFNIDFSSTKNMAETASNYSLFLDYSYGLHYHFKPLPALRLLAGAQVNLDFGAIYNTRNGNNPVSPKIAANIGFSGMADYRFRIRKQAFALRYQLDIPAVGYMFSQDYGASFYEIYLGNNNGLFLFSSFHNQWILKNYLTLELPLKPFTMRVTYLHHIHRTRVRDLETHINSNNLMIGFVKEFFTIPGRRQTDGNKYRRVFN